MNCVRKLHRFGWPIRFELWSSPPSSAAYLMTKRCPRPQPPVPQIPQPPSEQRGQWHVLWMMIASFSIRVTKMSYYIAIAMAKKTSSNTTTNLGCKSLQSHKFDWFWNGCPEQLTKRRKKKKNENYWTNWEKNCPKMMMCVGKIQLNGLTSGNWLKVFIIMWKILFLFCESCASRFLVKKVEAGVVPLVLVKFFSFFQSEPFFVNFFLS